MSSTDTGFTDAELEASLHTPINQIDQYIFLGNVNGREEKVLRKHQIQGIIRLATVSEEQETDQWVPTDIEQIPTFHIPDSASRSIVQIIRDCIPIIERFVAEKRNLLIHCQGGVSRSASVVIGYIMHSRKISAKDSLKYVESKRPCVWPNAGFWKELVVFTY